MRFIDYYLKNKKKFPELDFYEVKYSGDDIAYETTGQMDYLKRDMIIMIPKSYINSYKNHLNNIIEFQTYAYLNRDFFKDNETEKKKKQFYENAFLFDNKVLIPIYAFYDDDNICISLNEHKDVTNLLKSINNFLIKTGLNKKYFSISNTIPEESFSWYIQKKNFISITKYNMVKYLKIRRKSVKIVIKR